MTSQEKQMREEAARNELSRKIAQMVSSGDHDLPAIKSALESILEGWR